jgi:hypothetical protein
MNICTFAMILWFCDVISMGTYFVQLSKILHFSFISWRVCVLLVLVNIPWVADAPP